MKVDGQSLVLIDSTGFDCVVLKFPNVSRTLSHGVRKSIILNDLLGCILL